MATEGMDAAERPGSKQPRRRRFKLQFGIRTLLVVTAVVAVLLSFPARRARDQANLVREVEKLGGSCHRKPRESTPEWARRFLSEDQGSFVEKVQVGGLVARSRVSVNFDGLQLQVTNPAKLREVLSLPAMAEVRQLNLCGTAVCDESVDVLSTLSNLEFLILHMTAITEARAEMLRLALPKCQMFIYDSSNGPNAIRMYHGHQLVLTDALGAFRRAEAGELDAVETLLHLAGEHDRTEAAPAVEALSNIQDPKAMAVLIDSLDSANPRVRRAVVEVLGLRGNLERLDKALQDSHVNVRLEAVWSIAKLGGILTLQSLQRALEDHSPDVRQAALRALGKIEDPSVVETLVAAVDDPHADVRWQAIQVLERFQDVRAVDALIGALKGEQPLVRSAAAGVLGEIPDPSAIEPLKAATEDSDSFVRRHAEESLRKISAALDAPIFHFLAERDAKSPVVRRNERLKLTLPDSSLAYELLTPDLNRKMEALMAQLEPGDDNIAMSLRQYTEEFIYVLQGQLEIQLGEEVYTLDPGDSVYFEGPLLRRLAAKGDEPLRFISVITPFVF